MGYCFCDYCIFLHIHFCIHTLSGAVLPQELVDSNIKQERSDLNLRQMPNQMQQELGGVGDFYQLSPKSWPCSVRAEYVSPVKQKLVKSFFFGCAIWVEEPVKHFLLLCGFLIDTARKQNVPAKSMHQRADRCNFLALLVDPGSHRHKTLNALKHQYLVLLANLPDTLESKLLCMLQTEMFLFSLPFPVRKTVKTGKCGYMRTSSSKISVSCCYWSTCIHTCQFLQSFSLEKIGWRETFLSVT